MPIPTTMTYYARAFHGPNGRVRHVAVSLPYIASIADLPHYQPPRSVEPQQRGPAMTTKRIRRVLGRDREYSEKLRDKIVFEATSSRIMREGF